MQQFEIVIVDKLPKTKESVENAREWLLNHLKMFGIEMKYFSIKSFGAYSYGEAYMGIATLASEEPITLEKLNRILPEDKPEVKGLSGRALREI